MVLSVVLQTIAVAALILLPLLSKGERISLADHFTIVPPYSPVGAAHPNTGRARPASRGRRVCIVCFNSPHLQQIGETGERTTDAAEPISDALPGSLERPGIPGGLAGTDKGPKRPDEGSSQPHAKQRITITHLEPAMLQHRVEPVYPTLAKQLHREGRVELRAIIATDGSIQSLEVLSGDPLLIPSALAAVREWRYRPTILNGQPYEVETHITVIYSLAW